ncbi:MAG: AAA family ATPase, partial [Candidatus Coatesbacteria bacterium]|nr:AAA family ATPase [Candidatus Coatesbacteria bacterium]
MHKRYRLTRRWVEGDGLSGRRLAELRSLPPSAPWGIIALRPCSAGPSTIKTPDRHRFRRRIDAAGRRCGQSIHQQSEAPLFLKKIYIAGFKSFPDPLELDLREGMTAIVGPNGCGKTNISDAVRWCLGEQSPRSLRGNQMADVIFSGAAERKPLGMAEVSLLLSNEGHVLDSPYDEVQITRRLFRSGESAYLLNQRPCRLKDITGLLTDTGIGTKAYSLIEQAQVDQILSKDPRERRLIFDEAAGIGRYKRHRAEARRKLEDVEAQQLRLAERLDEIAVRLRSLRREVRKVEHHKRLGEEIRTYQALMSRHHWEGHQERIDELESSAEKLRD